MKIIFHNPNHSTTTISAKTLQLAINKYIIDKRGYMLGIIVAATSIALFLNLILKKVHLPTIIGYILTGTIIAYVFNLHEAVNNHELK